MSQLNVYSSPLVPPFPASSPQLGTASCRSLMNTGSDRRGTPRPGAPPSATDQPVRLPSFSQLVEGVGGDVHPLASSPSGLDPRQPYLAGHPPPLSSHTSSQYATLPRSSTPGPATQWHQSHPSASFQQHPHLLPHQTRTHSPSPSLAQYAPSAPRTSFNPGHPLLSVSTPPQPSSQPTSAPTLPPLTAISTIPYDPEPRLWTIQPESVHSFNDLRDSTDRPRYPYPILIRAAIMSSPEKKLKLQDIYTAIETKYPFFRTAGDGWKNSIRHNLSLVKYFQKVPRGQHEPGKGGYWVIRDEPVVSPTAGEPSRPRPSHVPELAPIVPSRSLASPVSPTGQYPYHPQSPTQAFRAQTPVGHLSAATSGHGRTNLPHSAPAPGMSPQQWLDVQRAEAAQLGRRHSLPHPLSAVQQPPAPGQMSAYHASMASPGLSSSSSSGRARAETGIHAYRATRDPAGYGRGSSRSPPRGTAPPAAVQQQQRQWFRERANSSASNFPADQHFESSDEDEDDDE